MSVRDRWIKRRAITLASKPGDNVTRMSAITALA
jgi:hypothetical protein